MKKTSSPSRRESAASTRVEEAAPARPRIALFAFELLGEPRSPLSFATLLAAALERNELVVHLFSNKPTSFPRTHVITSSEPSSAPVAQARALCAAATEHVGHVAQQEGPFVACHALQWSSVPAVLSAARHGGARSLVTFLDTVFSRHGQVNGEPDVAQVRRLEQVAVERCDEVLASSEPIRQELAWLYGSAVARVVAAEPMEPFPTGDEVIPASAHRLAFLGSWDAAGGSDLFLETLRILAADNPAWRFAVSGDSVPRARLEADLRRRGQGELIERIETGPNAGAILVPGTIALVPSRQALSLAPVLTAWRSGCPAIVSRTGPYHAIDEDLNGFCTLPSATAMAEAARKMALNPELVHARGAAGRRKFEKQFTWSAVVHTMNDLYRELPRAETNVHD